MKPFKLSISQGLPCNIITKIRRITSLNSRSYVAIIIRIISSSEIKSGRLHFPKFSIILPSFLYAESNYFVAIKIIMYAFKKYIEKEHK